MNNLPQSTSLQLVQLEGDIALIDSRVYCSEVLLVDHADWIADTLKPNLAEIEARFGSIRFETGSKTQASGRYQPKPEIYALLTEPQCNACLVLSRNLRRTIALKLDLVADFERAKILVKEYFEQRLAAAITKPEPTPIASPDIPANLIRKSQSEIYQLASDYVQIRSQAEATMPTLIEILDALADPAGVPAATEWFTARSWLAANGYKMQLKQQRQFFQAIANCHRFLTIATPQQHKGVNCYSNQHEILLRACATNVLKLGYKRTASFI